MKFDQQAIFDYVKEIREQLHQIPEVGLELPETRKFVCDELDRLNIPYVLNSQDSGIVATIQGSSAGKVIALRADMDALSMTEETGLPYSSKHSGAMHSCGHDAHTAMLLGTSRILLDNVEHIHGTVKLIFQTGEEIAKGAKIMIEEGALESPEVDAIFGLHIASIPNVDYPSGTLVLTPGCAMVSYDRFIIEVEGVGCHGAIPEKGVDPIVIGSNIVLALEEIIAREMPAQTPAVVTIGKFIAGDTFNVIPNTALLEGTIRAVKEETRQLIVRRIEEISQSIARAYRGKVDVRIDWGAPPVINDHEMIALAQKAGIKALGEDWVVVDPDLLNMGGEDFAYYLQKKPGAYMFIVTNSEFPQHNPKYNFEEELLWRGPAVFSAIVEEFLI